MASRTWYGRRKPEPLTAAAVTVAVNNPPSHVQWGGAGWQQEVWAHYDTTPELHAASAFMGYAFNRAKMIAVDVDPITLELGEEPTDDPVATALIARLFGGPTGRAQAQKQIGIHLTGPGDCWVLASDLDPDVDGQTWQILSVNEVTKAGNIIRIQNLDGTQRDLMDTELLFRLFEPHPRRRWDADSPSLALLPTFRELAGLSAQIMAAIRSRLATGGVWLLPQSAGLPDSVDEAGRKVPGGAVGWMRMLADAMITAISNPEDPSSLVPIVSLIPDEILDKIKDPIRFVQDLMTDIQPLREAAQKRIGIGMPMAAEMLLGMGDVNHWGQWFMDESFVKGPLAAWLSLPADAFTTHYLRPGMRLAGKNAALFAITFDTRDLLTKDNAENAKAAYGAGVLSEEAYLRVLGFNPDKDAATPVERAQRLVVEILGRGNPEALQELPPTIAALFPGIKLAPVQLVAQPGQSTAPAKPLELGPGPSAAAPSTTVTQSPPTRPAASPAAPSAP